VSFTSKHFCYFPKFCTSNEEKVFKQLVTTKVTQSNLSAN